MIACDNQACAYQWVSSAVRARAFHGFLQLTHARAPQFHLECVNLAAPLPDHWYCRECVAKGFAPRKGRKK